MKVAVAVLVLVVVALVQGPPRAGAQECLCSERAVPFCLPREGVLVQRFAASAQLCEVKKGAEPCPDGQARMCIPAAAPA